MIVYVVVPFASNGIEVLEDMIGVFKKREDAEQYIESNDFEHYQLEPCPLS